MSDVARLLSPSYCSGDVVARYTVYAVQVQEYFGHSGISIGTVVSVSCLMHDKSACRLLIAHDPRGRGSFGVRLGLVR